MILPDLAVFVGDSGGAAADSRDSVRKRTVRERRSPRDMVRDCARSSRAEPAATGETPSVERRSLATLREGVTEVKVGEPGEVDGAGEAGMPM